MILTFYCAMTTSSTMEVYEHYKGFRELTMHKTIPKLILRKTNKLKSDDLK